MFSEERRGLTRLLTLAQMLCKRAWKLSELATEFEVNRSTIWRNIQTLGDAGFPIAEGRDGWRITAQETLPTTFTAPELLSLFVAASTPALNSGAPLSKPLKTALRKVETLVNPKHAGHACRLDKCVKGRY